MSNVELGSTQDAASEPYIDVSTLELPVLPDVASRLIKIGNDPAWKIEEACDLIRRDPSLTAKLLKLANSPLYSLDAQIESVQQCIARLGIAVVRNLVLAIHSSRVFRVPGFEAEVSESFRRSLLAAAFAEEIARRCRINVERSFLCGLMHDVGRPTIIQAVVDQHQPLNDQTRHSARRAVEAFGLTVAAELVSSWGLPDEVAQAIAALGDEDEASDIAETLRLAVSFADLVDRDAIDDADTLFQHPSVSRLNLYRPDIEAVLQASEKLGEWARSFA